MRRSPSDEAFIRERIAAGDTEPEIRDALVAQFGPGVLEPAKGGFGMLAWLLPLVAILGAGSRSRCLFAGGVGRGASRGSAPVDPEARASPRREAARFDGRALRACARAAQRPTVPWRRLRSGLEGDRVCATSEAAQEPGFLRASSFKGRRRGRPMRWIRAPCRLPRPVSSRSSPPACSTLVPGYLSAVSAVDADS